LFNTIFKEAICFVKLQAVIVHNATKLVKEYHACTNWQEQEIKTDINQNLTIKKQLTQIASQLNAISNFILE